MWTNGVVEFERICGVIEFLKLSTIVPYSEQLKNKKEDAAFNKIDIALHYW